VVAISAAGRCAGISCSPCARTQWRSRAESRKSRERVDSLATIEAR